MKIERTKNAGRNILFGVVLKTYQIIVPFFMRTAMIYIMGAQYLGLNSLFASVLQVLNLAELGVGGAMVYSMYRPIAEDDHKTICALLALYRKYYRIIGAVILVGGLIVIPFLPNIIKMDTVPSDINVYILYLLNLLTTVMSYWLYSYKNSLLNAFQRTDVESKITMICSTVTYLVQFVVLVCWKNFYAYTIVMLLVRIVNNLMTAHVVNKMYPQYKPSGKLDKQIVSDINQRVKDLFTARIGSVVYDSSDTIVVSAFLGMRILAVYQNYAFIMTSVAGFIGTVFSACTAGIGNSLVLETKEKNFNDFKKFTFIIGWICSVCSCCFLTLYQPFMELWVGKDLMLDFSAVVCFVTYFCTKQINSLLNLYKDAAGIWHEDRFRPLVASLANLGMNLFLVRYIGIYGILIATVLAILLVGGPWLLHNLFTKIFDKEMLFPYLKHLGGTVSIIVVDCCVCFWICELIPIKSLVLQLLINVVICAIVPNIINYIVFGKKTEFKEMLILIDRMTNNKLHFVLEKLA